MSDLPYMKNNSMRYEMGGKGAPKPIIFNVIGETKYDPLTRSLGGLVKDSKTKVSVPDPLQRASGFQTENCIVGKNASKVPGRHYSQIPYPGRFLYTVGEPVK